MEQLDYNLLFRWFVGLSIDDPVWDATVFCKNRDRLLDGDIAAKFFVAVLNLPPVRKLLSSDHFSVDGTLIEAWASVKSFVPKDDGDPRSGIDGERDGLDDMVSRFADQPVVETAAGVTRRSLRHDRVRGVEIAINVYKPRTASAPEPVAHDGCEFGVVLDGILEVTVGGCIHKLQKGDLISYPSTGSPTPARHRHGRSGSISNGIRCNTEGPNRIDADTELCVGNSNRRN